MAALDPTLAPIPLGDAPLTPIPLAEGTPTPASSPSPSRPVKTRGPVKPAPIPLALTPAATPLSTPDGLTSPDPRGGFQQFATGVLEVGEQAIESTAGMLYQTAKGLGASLNEKAGPNDYAPPGSLQMVIPALIKLGHSFPLPGLGGGLGRTYTQEDAQNLLAATDAGREALKTLVETARRSPSEVAGKAAANALLTFMPWSWVTKLIGAKNATGAATTAGRVSQTIEAENAEETLIRNADQFNQTVARTTGRGTVRPGRAGRVWVINPSTAAAAEEGTLSAKRFNRLREAGKFRKVPQVVSSRVVPHIPSKTGPGPMTGTTFQFQNPINSTRLITIDGRLVEPEGPLGEAIQGAGVIFHDPITLEDGTVIAKPVYTPIGLFDMAKGSQDPVVVEQQMKDVLVGKPMRDIQVFHPDPKMQDIWQRAVGFINGIDSPAYIVEPDVLALGKMDLKQAEESASVEAIDRAASEERQQQLMKSEIVAAVRARTDALKTTPSAVGQFIHDQGADSLMVAPEAVAARQARADFDVLSGVMRTFGMRFRYRQNYLPQAVREGHGAINLALNIARRIAGGKHLVGTLIEAGVPVEDLPQAAVAADKMAGQAAPVGGKYDLRGDPAEVIRRVLKKAFPSMSPEVRAAVTSKAVNSLQAKVDGDFFDKVSTLERTQGISPESGAHGMTLTFDHVLHQGSTWEGLARLSALTGVKLTPVREIDELIGLEFENLAKNVRQARLLSALVNTRALSTTYQPGLKAFNAGRDTIWVTPKVNEFLRRIIPPHERLDWLTALRMYSAWNKEGTVNWNILIHAKTLTTGTLATIPWGHLAEASSDFINATKALAEFTPLLYEAAGAGLNIDHMVTQYGSIFSQAGKWIDDNIGGPGALASKPLQALGGIQDKMHKLLFDNYARYLALASYASLKRGYLSQGMSEAMAQRASAKMTNDVLGIPAKPDIPTWLSNYAYIFIFAPLFKLGSFRAMGRALGAFIPAAATDAERRVIIASAWAINAKAAAIQFVASNLIQHALTGTWAMSNPPGHQLDIWTGEYGATEKGKTEPLFVRLKDFNTDPEVFALKWMKAVDKSTTAGTPLDVSPVVQELSSLSGPLSKFGIDVVEAAAQRKLDTQMLGTLEAEFATPSWVQTIAKSVGQFPLRPTEVSIPSKDLWWVALGFSPFGVPPDQASVKGLGLGGIKLKGP